MNIKKLISYTAVLLVLCILLSACSGPEPTEPSAGHTPTSEPSLFPNLFPTEPPTTEPTEPELTLDTLRTAEFSDLPDYSLYYDAACYLLYFGIMDAPEGQFLPYEMVTQAQGAEIAGRLTGKARSLEEASEAPLTRAGLAHLLYDTAEALGYSREITAHELPYPDGDQVDPEDLEALLWVESQGLFDTFLGYRLLPNTAVSRLQVAQAVIALRAMDLEDDLAIQIRDDLPLRNQFSIAMDNHEAIQAAVDAAGEKYGAAAIQVAVIENGMVTDTYTYGWATRKTEEMTDDHKIRVASISKVAVGITAQLLREDGIIGLDADISDYWGFTIKNPEHPEIPTTIRQILTHTSAIVNGSLSDLDYDSIKNRLKGSGFSGVTPGDIRDWTYNNLAFCVLGMTLELAMDRTANDYLAERLFVPMDMDAAFGAGEIQNTDLLATVYRSDNEVGLSVSKAKNMLSSSYPGAKGNQFPGGLTASAYDVAKLIALLAGDGVYEGVRLLDAESVELMETWIETPVSDGSCQALPMRYRPDFYGREGLFFHTGSAYGVYNAATYDPYAGDGVVVLTTGASGAKDSNSIYKVCADIMEYIYETLE